MVDLDIRAKLINWFNSNFVDAYREKGLRNSQAFILIDRRKTGSGPSSVELLSLRMLPPNLRGFMAHRTEMIGTVYSTGKEFIEMLSWWE